MDSWLKCVWAKIIRTTIGPHLSKHALKNSNVSEIAKTETDSNNTK